MQESIDKSDLILENLALKSLVIALYSVSLDRPLIDARATDIFLKLSARGQLEEKTKNNYLTQLLEELHYFGYPQ